MNLGKILLSFRTLLVFRKMFGLISGCCMGVDRKLRKPILISIIKKLYLLFYSSNSASFSQDLPKLCPTTHNKPFNSYLKRENKITF